MIPVWIGVPLVETMEDHKGKETSPWAIGVGKDLGGGAYTYIEHGNEDDGKSGKTNIGLNVSF